LESLVITDFYACEGLKYGSIGEFGGIIGDWSKP